MTQGVISPSLIPGWPAPVVGVRESLDLVLQQSGFNASVLSPDGLAVDNVDVAEAFLAGYVGSAAQLAFNKAAWLTALAALRDEKFAAGRIYSDGKVYQIDPASITNMSAMGALATSVLNGTPGAAAWPAGFFWIAADNSQTPMNAAQLYAFVQDMAAYVSSLITVNYSLKRAIDAVETLEQLQAIDINAGWPSNP